MPTGRNLRPGSYLLSLSTVRQPLADAPTTLVEVVSKRRSVPAKPGAEEADVRRCAGEPQPVPSSGSCAAKAPAQEPPQRAPARGDAVSSIPPANSDGKHDVLGVATPGAGLDSGSTAEGLGRLVAIFVLALIGAILLTTVALVTRFFRGSWNP